jgi:hypothetical protein
MTEFKIKYGLFLRMFDVLSSHELELQSLSKTNKPTLVFRLSAHPPSRSTTRQLPEISLPFLC